MLWRESLGLRCCPSWDYFCHGLNVCVSPKFTCWNPTWGGLWEIIVLKWGREGRVVMNAVCPCEQQGRAWFSLFPTISGHNEKTAICKLRKRSSPVTTSAGILVWDFPASRNVGSKCLLCEPPPLPSLTMVINSSIPNRPTLPLAIFIEVHHVEKIRTFFRL